MIGGALKIFELKLKELRGGAKFAGVGDDKFDVRVEFGLQLIRCRYDCKCISEYCNLWKQGNVFFNFANA